MINIDVFSDLPNDQVLKSKILELVIYNVESELLAIRFFCLTEISLNTRTFGSQLRKCFASRTFVGEVQMGPRDLKIRVLIERKSKKLKSFFVPGNVFTFLLVKYNNFYLRICHWANNTKATLQIKFWFAFFRLTNMKTLERLVARQTKFDIYNCGNFCLIVTTIR